MRDHRKLRAFTLADALVEEVYAATAQIPPHEQYGLISQLRRAAVSVAGNIVEGCGRHHLGDLFRFLDHAFGSLREVGYYVDLSARLGYLSAARAGELSAQVDQAASALTGYIRTVQSWRK